MEIVDSFLSDVSGNEAVETNVFYPLSKGYGVKGVIIKR
jgi:hypothetical protein